MKSPDRRTAIRWILIVLTAWLLPSYSLMVVLLVPEVIQNGRDFDALGALELGLKAPLIGLAFGFPSWIIGFGLWALAHRIGRDTGTAAALIGVAAPVPLLIWYLHEMWAVIRLEDRSFSVYQLMHREGAFTVATLLIGALTGWLIWRIAYPKSRSLADPGHP